MHADIDYTTLLEENCVDLVGSVSNIRLSGIAHIHAPLFRMIHFHTYFFIAFVP